MRGLYAITPDGVGTGDLLVRVGALADGGGRWIQYRNKSATSAERTEQARALASLCRARDLRLIINDDVELALAVSADGVHLGADDGDLRAARRRIGTGMILGASCYNRPELAEAAAAAGVDYVALGAVFPSATKPGAVHARLPLIAEVRHRVGLPVVAIGGITLDNAPDVVAAGADMVAVISDLFEAPDIAARTAGFQSIFD
jgi:thiamine-phosphate pyrophosphorylase